MTKPLEIEAIQMEEFLQIDNERIKRILAIKLDFLTGKITLTEARQQLLASFKEVTAQEFAISEQYLKQFGISDDLFTEKIEEVLSIFAGLLVSDARPLAAGHPVKTYLDEVKAITQLLTDMKAMLSQKFIKNQWIELYERLEELNIHFARKQNQLFSALERKGFDTPTKVMWTLEDNIIATIKQARTHLNAEQDDEFLALQEKIISLVEGMMQKEENILYPTAMALLSEEDFVAMRTGDDEIGYCLIAPPPPYHGKQGVQATNFSTSELLQDLNALLKKHGGENSVGIISGENVLDVSQGKLTLEQINLIFKHMKVDLSFVDENNIVKFYTDTEHRIFPRSAGVIGREVQNCHPRDSVSTVEEIIKAFKAGKQDEAEFWLEMKGQFIYIIFTAVRDEAGNFRGVLETMQDVTHIRSLTGSQRLLSWQQ